MFRFSQLRGQQVHDAAAALHLNFMDIFLYQSIENQLTIHHTFFDKTKSSSGTVANPNAIPYGVYPPLTPLMFAMSRPDPSITVIQALFREGANPNFGPMGKTAAEYVAFAAKKWNWNPTKERQIRILFSEYGAEF